MRRSGTQKALSVQGDGRIVGTDTHTRTHTKPGEPGPGSRGERREKAGKSDERGSWRCRPLAASHPGRGAGEQSPALGARRDVGRRGPSASPAHPTSPLPARDPLSGWHSPAVHPGSARASRQSRAAPRQGMVQRPLVSAATPAPRPPEPPFQGRQRGRPRLQRRGGHGAGVGDPREGGGPGPRPAQVARRDNPAGPARRRRERLVRALQCDAVGGLGLATPKASLSLSLSLPRACQDAFGWASGHRPREGAPLQFQASRLSGDKPRARRRVKS